MKTAGDPGLRSAAHDMPEPGRRLTHPEGLAAIGPQRVRSVDYTDRQTENPGF